MHSISFGLQIRCGHKTQSSCWLFFFRCSFIRLYWRSVVAQFSQLCPLRSSDRFNSTRHSSCSWLRLFKDLEEVKAAVTGSLSIMFDYRGWQTDRGNGTARYSMYWPLAVGYYGDVIRGRPTAAQYASEAVGVSRQCMWRVKTSALLPGHDWLMCGDCKLRVTPLTVECSLLTDTDLLLLLRLLASLGPTFTLHARLVSI